MNAADFAATIKATKPAGKDRRPQEYDPGTGRYTSHGEIGSAHIGFRPDMLAAAQQLLGLDHPPTVKELRAALKDLLAGSRTRIDGYTTSLSRSELLGHLKSEGIIPFPRETLTETKVSTEELASLLVAANDVAAAFGPEALHRVTELRVIRGGEQTLGFGMTSVTPGNRLTITLYLPEPVEEPPQEMWPLVEQQAIITGGPKAVYALMVHELCHGVAFHWARTAKPGQLYNDRQRTMNLLGVWALDLTKDKDETRNKATGFPRDHYASMNPAELAAETLSERVLFPDTPKRGGAAGIIVDEVTRDRSDMNTPRSWTKATKPAGPDRHPQEYDPATGRYTSDRSGLPDKPTFTAEEAAARGLGTGQCPMISADDVNVERVADRVEKLLRALDRPPPEQVVDLVEQMAVDATVFHGRLATTEGVVAAAVFPCLEHTPTGFKVNEERLANVVAELVGTREAEVVRMFGTTDVKVIARELGEAAAGTDLGDATFWEGDAGLIMADVGSAAHRLWRRFFDVEDLGGGVSVVTSKATGERTVVFPSGPLLVATGGFGWGNPNRVRVSVRHPKVVLNELFGGSKGDEFDADGRVAAGSVLDRELGVLTNPTVEGLAGTSIVLRDGESPDGLVAAWRRLLVGDRLREAVESDRDGFVAWREAETNRLEGGGAYRAHCRREPPGEVVSEDELAGLLASGDAHSEWWRGLQAVSEQDAVRMADNWLSGEMFPGVGTFGNGTYVASTGVEGGLGSGLDVVRASYATDSNDAVLHGALRSDALVISEREGIELAARLYQELMGRGVRGIPEDYGELLALAGVDAIEHVGGSDGRVLILLNRRKVVSSDTVLVGRGSRRLGGAVKATKPAGPDRRPQEYDPSTGRYTSDRTGLPAGPTLSAEEAAKQRVGTGVCPMIRADDVDVDKVADRIVSWVRAKSREVLPAGCAKLVDRLYKAALPFNGRKARATFEMADGVFDAFRALRVTEQGTLKCDVNALWKVWSYNAEVWREAFGVSTPDKIARMVDEAAAGMKLGFPVGDRPFLDTPIDAVIGTGWGIGNEDTLPLAKQLWDRFVVTQDLGDGAVLRVFAKTGVSKLGLAAGPLNVIGYQDWEGRFGVKDQQRLTDELFGDAAVSFYKNGQLNDLSALGATARNLSPNVVLQGEWSLDVSSPGDVNRLLASWKRLLAGDEFRDVVTRERPALVAWERDRNLDLYERHCAEQPPGEVVTDDELARMLASGEAHSEWWRAIIGVSMGAAGRMADDWLFGRMFAGRGTFGDGTYTASTGVRGRLGEGSDVVDREYMTRDDRSVRLHGALRSDALVISEEEGRVLAARLQEALRERGELPPEDYGQMLALAGIDAVEHVGAVDGRVLILLNRRKVVSSGTVRFGDGSVRRRRPPRKATKATKPGGGGQPQEYDPGTGRYASSGVPSAPTVRAENAGLYGGTGGCPIIRADDVDVERVADRLAERLLAKQPRFVRDLVRADRLVDEHLVGRAVLDPVRMGDYLRGLARSVVKQGDGTVRVDRNVLHATLWADLSAAAFTEFVFGDRDVDEIADLFEAEAATKPVAGIGLGDDPAGLFSDRDLKEPVFSLLDRFVDVERVSLGGVFEARVVTSKLTGRVLVHSPAPRGLAVYREDSVVVRDDDSLAAMGQRLDVWLAKQFERENAVTEEDRLEVLRSSDAELAVREIAGTFNRFVPLMMVVGSKEEAAGLVGTLEQVAAISEQAVSGTLRDDVRAGRLTGQTTTFDLYREHCEQEPPGMVVSDDELAGMLASGEAHSEWWRGLNPAGFGEESAQRMAADWLHNEMFPGQGTFGDGTYVAAVDPDEQAGERREGRFGSARTVASSRYAGAKGVVLHGALRRDAVVIPESEAEQLVERLVEALGRRGVWLRESEADVGRLLALAGVDAIEHVGRQDGRVLILLNRRRVVSSSTVTIAGNPVVISKATKPGGGGQPQEYDPATGRYEGVWSSERVVEWADRFMGTLVNEWGRDLPERVRDNPALLVKLWAASETLRRLRSDPRWVEAFARVPVDEIRWPSPGTFRPTVGVEETASVFGLPVDELSWVFTRLEQWSIGSWHSGWYDVAGERFGMQDRVGRARVPAGKAGIPPRVPSDADRLLFDALVDVHRAHTPDVRVRVWRGVSGREQARLGSDGVVDELPLTAWSLDRRVAERFGPVMETVVGLRDGLLSAFWSGLGCAAEREVLLRPGRKSARFAGRDVLLKLLSGETVARLRELFGEEQADHFGERDEHVVGVDDVAPRVPAVDVDDEVN